MPNGYAGKWLDVDLTKGKVKEAIFEEKVLQQFFGGRGLAAKIPLQIRSERSGLILIHMLPRAHS